MLSSSGFLFSSYGDHRDLHSFPTRRSSDLRSDSRAGADGKYGYVRGGNSLHQTEGGCQVAAVEIAQDDFRDRKSTRLNSSLSSISYAVFCLKKKNKTQASSPESDSIL